MPRPLKFDVCLLLLLATIQACKESSDKQWNNAAIIDSRNHLQSIWAALQKCEEQTGELPQGLGTNRPGRLSWRVHLLPFLGEDERQLYSEFHLGEPWDSEHNLALLNKKPVVYESPIKGGDDTTTTCYCGLQAQSSDEDRSNSRQNSDVLVIEVDPNDSVPWTQPESTNAFVRAQSHIKGRHEGSYFILLKNGSIELRTAN